jgi:ribosomal protein S18 acetylase RimI-like enzyme
MIIRDATERDVAGIANLHAESWRASYRGVLSDEYLENNVIRDRLAVWQARYSVATCKPMFVLVAEARSELTGFACVFPNEDDVFGSFLDNLHVSPLLTGHGIGKQLLSEAARRLITSGSHAGLHLWVVDQNKRARQFYERAGAVVVNSSENLMPDGQRVKALRCCWNDLGTLLR